MTVPFPHTAIGQPKPSMMASRDSESGNRTTPPPHPLASASASASASVSVSASASQASDMLEKTTLDGRVDTLSSGFSSGDESQQSSVEQNPVDCTPPSSGSTVHSSGWPSTTVETPPSSTSLPQGQQLPPPPPRFRWKHGWGEVDPELDIHGSDLTGAVHQVLMSLPLDLRNDLGLEDASNVHVDYLTEGRSNKVFTVKTTKAQELIFRLALPVCPRARVESEVATMRYVRSFTTIPVPEVYAWDSSTRNALGYEWILMEKAAGVPYHEAEEHFSLPQKVDIGRQLADWVHQLSSLRLDSIGSIFYAPNSTSTYTMGSPIAEKFMVDWRPEYITPTRDPFNMTPHRSVHSFVRALVDVINAEANDERQQCRAKAIDAVFSVAEAVDRWAKENGVEADHNSKDMPPMEEEERFFVARDDLCRAILKESGTYQVPPPISSNSDIYWRSRPEMADDEDEWLKLIYQPEDCPVDLQSASYRTHGLDRQKSVSAKLIEMVNKLFDDRDILPPGSTTLFHWDINMSNLFVDAKTAKLTALIDWEQAHALPDWLILGAYPALMETDHCNPARLPDTIDEWNGEISDGKEWGEWDVAEFEAKMMRAGFRERLRQLQSPWLAVTDLADVDEREMINLRECTGCNPPWLSPVEIFIKYEEEYRGRVISWKEEDSDEKTSESTTTDAIAAANEHISRQCQANTTSQAETLLTLRRDVFKLALFDLKLAENEDIADQIAYRLSRYEATYQVDACKMGDDASTKINDDASKEINEDIPTEIHEDGPIEIEEESA